MLKTILMIKSEELELASGPLLARCSESIASSAWSRSKDMCSHERIDPERDLGVVSAPFPLDAASAIERRPLLSQVADKAADVHDLENCVWLTSKSDIPYVIEPQVIEPATPVSLEVAEPGTPMMLYLLGFVVYFCDESVGGLMPLLKSDADLTKVESGFLYAAGHGFAILLSCWTSSYLGYGQDGPRTVLIWAAICLLVGSGVFATAVICRGLLSKVAMFSFGIIGRVVWGLGCRQYS